MCGASRSSQFENRLADQISAAIIKGAETQGIRMDSLADKVADRVTEQVASQLSGAVAQRVTAKVAGRITDQVLSNL